MPETLQPEPALDGLADAASGGLAVSERIGLAIARLEWRLGDLKSRKGAGLPAVGETAASGETTLLRTSPTSLLLVAETACPQEATKLGRALAAAVVDVSHGFVVLTLDGCPARPLLDGLAPVDLAEDVFSAGCLRRTHIAGHAVIVHCIAQSRFDLYVDRSLAWSLWQSIARRLT